MAKKQNQMYNKEIKEEFLSTLPEETAKVYKYAFYKSFDTEDVLQKDLYDFTTDEIKDVLISADRTTLNSIRLIYTVFDSYIDWAVKFRRSNINPIKSIRVNELESYIDKSKKLYYSESEINEIENELVNAQDAVVVRLIFEGVFGYSGSEILNLRENDIKGNVLHVKDVKHGEREIEVSDKCINLIRQALKEEEYYTKNSTDTNGKYATKPLVENEENGFVLRITRTGQFNKSNEPANKHLIYRRLSKIGEYFNYPYFTAKNIQKSGMIKMAKDLFLRDGKLENEQLYEIADRFGIQKTVVNGYEYYQVTNLKQFINRDTILDLYDIDIEK